VFHFCPAIPRLVGMPGALDFPARGTIVDVQGDTIIFHPLATTYQLHLDRLPEARIQPSDRQIDGLIRIRARKLWTVPSGGLFIAPIFGPPRIVQGRVRHLDEKHLVLNAGTNVVVELPATNSALDLASGAIRLGSLVNVVALPGARFEPLQPAAG
jgi:hypothetical protein